MAPSGETGPDETIVPLDGDDREAIREVINAAATAYDGVIPPTCYADPYMDAEELADEMAEMDFVGGERSSRLLGVMGFQPVLDVCLIRHLYVRPAHQRTGIGTRLLTHGIDRADGRPLLVGTWAAADWAITFYENHGFENLGTDRQLLSRYWDVTDEHAAASVVLRDRGTDTVEDSSNR